MFYVRAGVNVDGVGNVIWGGDDIFDIVIVKVAVACCCCHRLFIFCSLDYCSNCSGCFLFLCMLLLLLLVF